MQFYQQRLANERTANQPTRSPSNNQGNYQHTNPPTNPRNRPQPQNSFTPGYQGGYNPNQRPPPPARPTPPPLVPQQGYQQRYAPPPAPGPGRMPRQQDFQQPGENRPGPPGNFRQRGRPHTSGDFEEGPNYRDNSSSWEGRGRQNPSYQQSERRDNRNPRRNQGPNNQQDDGNYSSNEGNFKSNQRNFQPNPRNFQNEQDNRWPERTEKWQEPRGPRPDRQEPRGPPKFDNRQDNRHEFRQDNRQNNREGFRQEGEDFRQGRGGRGRRGQPYDNRSERPNYRDRDEEPRGEYSGRGGPRGRGRGRGRGREPALAPEIKEERQESEESHSMQLQQSHSQQISKEASNFDSVESQESRSRSGSEADEESQSASVSDEDESIRVESEEIQQDEERAHEQSSQEPDTMQRIDTMVSREQYDERLETFRMNNRSREDGLRLDTGRSFAIFEIDRETSEPDIKLALKRFRRSTNRGEDDDEQDETSDLPRSRRGLEITMRHIQKKIIDADGIQPKYLAFPLPPGERKFEFLHIYDFLWNRMREMIKDVSRLNEKDRGTEAVVTICQEMLRFFIIAVRQGRLPHDCRLEFDSKMNLESITKILTQLLEIYETAHHRSEGTGASAYISPHEPEIIGYAIIICNDLQNSLNDKLRVRLSAEGLGHPLLSSAEIETALKVKRAVRIRDYQTFFGVLDRAETDYVQACLLLHLLPAVRRETLRVLQKAMRKLPLGTLSRKLRYGPGMEKEFAALLEHVQAQVLFENGQQMVVLSGHEENIQDCREAFAYRFPNDKQLRTNYPGSQPKPHLLRPNLLSRQELTKRSWYQGDYLQRIADFYNQPYTKKVVALPAPVAIKPTVVVDNSLSPGLSQQGSDEMGDKGKKGEVAVVMNRQFLQKRRRELLRDRFNKLLQQQVQTLVRRSDVHSQHQRKRGLNMCAAIWQVLRLAALEQAFQNIIEHAQQKLVITRTLDALAQLVQTKQQIISTLHTASTERNDFKPQYRYRPLSEAVDPRPSLPENLFQQLSTVAGSKQGAQRVRLLLLFSSSEQQRLEPAHRQLLKNLFRFVAVGPQSCQEGDRLVDRLCGQEGPGPAQLQGSRSQQVTKGSLTVQVKLLHYRHLEDALPFLCGWDCVIFLDLHGDITHFTRTYKVFSQYRRRALQAILGESPKPSIRFAILTVCRSQRLENTVPAKHKEEWSTRWHSLQTQAQRLSLPFRHFLVQHVSGSLSVKPPKDEQRLEIVTVNELLCQMEKNMKYVIDETYHKRPISFFQLYLKANLRCLIKNIEKLARKYERLNWSTLLLRAAYIISDSPSAQLPHLTPSRRLEMNRILSKKLTFAKELAQSLMKIELENRYKIMRTRSPYLTCEQVLAATIEEYLQNFSKEQRSDKLQMVAEYVILENCELTFGESITGNARGLVTYIFTQLKKQFKHLRLILPKNFQFLILPSQLSPEPPIVPLVQTIPIYHREELLRQLLAELGDELKVFGAKAIKTS